MRSLQNIIELFYGDPADEQTCRGMEHSIKATIPGDYKVVCTVGKNLAIHINFTFDDEEDAIIFKLRYW